MEALQREEAAWLEAVVDERIALDPGAAPVPLPELADPRAAVRAVRVGRRVEWATRALTQGELLAAFARHCAEELDDVEVVESEPDLLVARWRSEVSRIELRAGFVGFERLVSSGPTMLLGDVEGEHERLVRAFLDDAELRTRLAVCDPGRLERIGAPRSSVFVYLEWFLREEYGVKLLPAGAFTQGLIERGIISLGMG